MKNDKSQEDLARRYREYKAKNAAPTGDKLLKDMMPGQSGFSKAENNFWKKFVQGAVNAVPSVANLANKGMSSLASAVTGKDIPYTPFPYRAEFGDSNMPGASAGEFLGSMVMPGVGVAGNAVQGAIKGAPLIGKILGGATSGGLGAAAAGVTENPEQNLNGMNVGISSLIGGGTGGLLGIPAALAGRQLRAVKTAREANPKSPENPTGIRSPEQVAELGAKFPENSIDLASLAGHKKNAGFYSDVLGRLPLTGVRKAEQKSLKAYEGIKAENQSTWENFKKNAKDSNVKVDYEPLYKDLNEKYSSYLGIKQPKQPKGKARMSEEEFLSKLNPEQRKIAMKKLGINQNTISENTKRALLKEANVSLLKTINLGGDSLSDAIKKYQKLGDMARSTKAPSAKSEIMDAQKLVKQSIEESLQKSGRKDLIQEWQSANKSHINKLETGKALKNARVRQGETFSNTMGKNIVGSPAGKGVQLGIMGALGLVSGKGAAAAAGANAIGGISAKTARSKSLRDAYVSGEALNEKNLSKDIFPIWMRALGVGAKETPRAVGVGIAKADRERQKRKEEESR